jgi:kinesin family member 11
MRELKKEHHRKVVEITENAGKCLEKEYLVRRHKKQQLGLGSLYLQLTKIATTSSPGTLQVDELSCSTPRRRQIDLPSVESIEELRAPDYEELLKLFLESRVAGSRQMETRGIFQKCKNQHRHHLEIQEFLS